MPPRRELWRLARAGSVVGLAGVVLIGGCARAERGPAATVAPGQFAAVVHLKPTTFEPASVTVETSDTVIWVWDNPIIHNIIADGFGVGNQVSGTYSHTFRAPGTFAYHCSIHAGMTGEVNVLG